MDVTSAVANSRMTFRQYLVIFGALLCNLADGYDLSVAVSYTHLTLPTKA